MAGFRVDLTTLQEAANGVNGVLDMVAQQPVDKIPFDQSALGDNNLAGCCSDFLSGGQRGVSSLSQEGQKFASRLTDAMNAYRKADHGAALAAGGIFAGTGPDPAAN